jgi:receptor protein-tyrosine kinase
MSIVERALAKAGAGRARSEEPRPARPARPPVPVGAPASFTSSNPVLALDSEALRKAGLGPPSDMEHLLAEELRVIKRPLLLNAEGGNATLQNGNLAMIASALPGAGKTFMSFNLALSMANEMDWTVLLVDADVSRPTLSRCFGLADAPGLVNLLESEHGTLADHVFPTANPRLHFLPAGPTRTEAKELLASQRMRSLVDDLSASVADRRMVIFDSPPLLLTSEARVLASYTGQIVVIVEAGVTPRRSLMEAIELLDRNKAINLVLNKNRQLLGVGDYHYYGYETYGSAPAAD